MMLLIIFSYFMVNPVEWICWISTKTALARQYHQVHALRDLLRGVIFSLILNEMINNYQLSTNNHLLDHICTLRFGFLSDFDWVYEKDDAVTFAEWKLIRFQHSFPIFLESGFLNISIHFIPILISCKTCRLSVSLSMSGLAPKKYFVISLKSAKILLLNLVEDGGKGNDG